MGVLSLRRTLVSPEEVVKGALPWAAPEVLKGGAFKSSADIFSFGVVLWEIVTGEKPTGGALRNPRRAPQPARPCFMLEP